MRGRAPLGRGLRPVGGTQALENPRKTMRPSSLGPARSLSPWVLATLLVASLFGVGGLSAACGDGASGGVDTQPADARDGVEADAVADTADRDDGAADASDTTAPDTADVVDTADTADTFTRRDYTARGPYRVGYRSTSITYAPRDGSAARTLRLVAWYPTSATTGDDVLYAGLLPAPGVLGDAPPAALTAVPMVVFSHGNSSFAEQSAFLTEFLASHGYLVWAPDHTNNTFGEAVPAEMLHWRPDDLRAVIDYAQALPASDPLAALVGGRVAVVGHSFGGYTALAVGGATWAVDLMLAVCESGRVPALSCASLEAHEDLYRAGFGDPRVSAIVPMTPGALLTFGSAGTADIAVPALLMTGSRDQTTPNETEGDLAWQGLSTRPGNLRVDFANAGHFTFSDACSLPISVGEGDGCSPGFIDPEVAHRAINAYVLAFLERELAGDTEGFALLTGADEIEPDVTLTPAPQ